VSKMLGGILAIVVAVGLGLYVIFRFVVRGNVTTTATTAAPPAAVPAATPQPPPSDRTAQRIGAAADVITAIGGLAGNLGLGGGK
jgi:hypothetical protein